MFWKSEMKHLHLKVWKAWNSGTCSTLLATSITHLNSLSVGLCQGYSAVLLPQLSPENADANTSFTVNAEEASWIASLGVLSTPAGALLSGLLMDMCGRKSTIQYTTVPFIIGWVVIAMSEDIYTLCIGRWITGMAVGMASSVYVYVAEISLPSNRGFLSSFGPVFASLGVLLVYSFGYLMDCKIVAVACSFLAVLTFSAAQIIPETPSWLASHDNIGQASKSLKWLRRDSVVADRELAAILETVKVPCVSSADEENASGSICAILEKFTRPEVWKPFLIMITFFAFQEMTGLYSILYYAVDFFHQTGSSINDYIASILVGVLRFVVSVIGCIAIQKFMRRTLAITSYLIMALTMGIGAAYQHIYWDVDYEERPFQWLPLASILLNVCASMMGCLQLPWIMTGELFPLSVRGLMGGIVMCFAYFFIFLTVKFYPLAASLLHMNGLLWAFTAASVGGMIFSIIFLPETKNKTLGQIEESFGSREPVDNHQTIKSISFDVESARV